MPIGTRVLSTSGQQAVGNKTEEQFIFNDVVANLYTGALLYKDVTDAAEYNIKGSTALVGGKASAGRVVLGNNAAAGPLIGVFNGNPSEVQNLGDIKLVTEGVCRVSVIVAAGGAAANVGSSLIAPATPGAADSNAVIGAAVVNRTVGTALATGAALAVGAAIIPVPGGGSTTALVNAYVSIR